ncbi:VQ motif-containing protein 25-like [Arachis duranensis]|uniref:VQ motif-containing protein 25-like n=1 Tax=Arachis duranensis TaxID=130453 RepID=A0A6P4D1A9_ARADU|nr:VQ motif-containing protein 25-like [Arachis duranensis]
MTKKPHQTCNIPSSSASSKLVRRKDSHVISKFKPKIRIIHIYAPEIITTDTANFRELVQRLTGKPEDEKGKGKSKSDTASAKVTMKNLFEEDEQKFLNLQNKAMVNNENHEKQEDLWRRSKLNNEEKLNGFLEGFSELDGFMEELCTVPVVDQN